MVSYLFKGSGILPFHTPGRSLQISFIVHMNITGNTTSNLTVISGPDTIQELFESDVYNWLTLSAAVLPFYVALSRLPQEVDHIWRKSFSLPTLLYILARYGCIVAKSLNWSLAFVPPIMSSERTCNILANATNYVAILSSIGIQGLLLARAYALCQKKIPAITLGFCFLASFVMNLSGAIAFPGCLTILPTRAIILELVCTIFVILTDVLVFGICMWNIWGAWKLKREAGIQSARSLVSVLLTQSILRCCFVVVLTITDDILISLDSSSVFFQVLSESVNTYQNVLSSILVADFTLDLRSLNSAKIETNNASLPPIQLSNILQHIHQSFVIELATPEDTIVEGGVNHFDNIESDFMEESEVQPA